MTIKFSSLLSRASSVSGEGKERATPQKKSVSYE